MLPSRRHRAGALDVANASHRSSVCVCPDVWLHEATVASRSYSCGWMSTGNHVHAQVTDLISKPLHDLVVSRRSSFSKLLVHQDRQFGLGDRGGSFAAEVGCQPMPQYSETCRSSRPAPAISRVAAFHPWIRMLGSAGDRTPYLKREYYSILHVHSTLNTA
eukprot:7358567-Prymnesium_polylepis.1